MYYTTSNFGRWTLKMKKCQYCGLAAEMTREHVIPSWYYKGRNSKSGAGFSEKAKGKLVAGELKIGDVCRQCNNGPLSALDGYGKDLYARHMAHSTNTRTSQNFIFDYNLLVRWLLKLSYNSSRMTGNDVEILSEYRDIILGTAAIPPNLRVILKCVAPTVLRNGLPLPANAEDLDATHRPDWFRIGAFRVPGFDTAHWALRHVSINSYFFQIFVPSQASPPTASDMSSLLDALERDSDPYVNLDSKGEVQLPDAFMSSFTHLKSHMEQFPVTYQMPRSDLVERLVTENPESLYLRISRFDIESGLLDTTLNLLTELISSREVILVAKDKLEISIDGYCEDPRELVEIPEVVRFIRDLDMQWPHWLLFCDSQKPWFRLVFFCICGKPLPGGHVELDMPTIKPTFDRWFFSLNDLSNEFAISIEDNKRASKKIEMLIPR